MELFSAREIVAVFVVVVVAVVWDMIPLLASTMPLAANAPLLLIAEITCCRPPRIVGVLSSSKSVRTRRRPQEDAW